PLARRSCLFFNYARTLTPSLAARIHTDQGHPVDKAERRQFIGVKGATFWTGTQCHRLIFGVTTEQGKSGPVKRSFGLGPAQHFKLSLAQAFSRSHPFLFAVAMKNGHQNLCRFRINLPLTRDNEGHPQRQKSAPDANRSFALVVTLK